MGPLNGTSLFPLTDFMPTFSFITCQDPFNGAYPFVKVPNFRKEEKNHQCVKKLQCQLELITHPEVIRYMKDRDERPNVIYQ